MNESFEMECWFDFVRDLWNSMLIMKISRIFDRNALFPSTLKNRVIGQLCGRMKRKETSEKEKKNLKTNKKYSCSYQIGNGIKDNFVVISNVKWEANEKEKTNWSSQEKKLQTKKLTKIKE